MFESKFAFKVVCIDENNPIEYTVLDEINMDNIDEVCRYLKTNYANFDMDICKWVIIPIKKFHINNNK